MELHQSQKRIESIFKMLMEIATGNLTYRLEIYENTEEIEELVKLLNEFADRMQTTLTSLNLAESSNSSTESSVQAKQPAQETIIKLLEYINDHLEEPLPSTKELTSTL